MNVKVFKNKFNEYIDLDQKLAKYWVFRKRIDKLSNF